MKKYINAWSGIIVVLILVLLLRIIIVVDDTLIFIGLGMALIVYGKFMYVFQFNVGHGTVQKKCKRIRGFTIPIAIFYSLIGAMLVIPLVILYTDPSGLGRETINNLKYFFWSALFAYTIAFIIWYFHTYYETFYGSEYCAHLQFKNQGDSQKQIDDKIAFLHEYGRLK